MASLFTYIFRSKPSKKACTPIAILIARVVTTKIQNNFRPICRLIPKETNKRESTRYVSSVFVILNQMFPSTTKIYVYLVRGGAYGTL